MTEKGGTDEGAGDKTCASDIRETFCNNGCEVNNQFLIKHYYPFQWTLFKIHNQGKKQK